MTQAFSSRAPPRRVRAGNSSREQSRSPVHHLRKQASLLGLLPHQQNYNKQNPRYLLHFKRLFSEQEEKIKALSIQLQEKDARLERIERLLNNRTDRRIPQHQSQLPVPVLPLVNESAVQPLKKLKRKSDRGSYNLLRQSYLEEALFDQPEEEPPYEPKQTELHPITHDSSERRILVPIDRLRRISKAELQRRVREASQSMPTHP